MIGDCLRARNIDFEYGQARLEYASNVAKEIDSVNFLKRRAVEIPNGVASTSTTHKTRCCFQVKPTHVINAAGLTGRPNVDWCEDHKVRAQCVELNRATEKRGKG
jgi:hypothetical protein